jgi:hypothetical protein
MLSKLRSMPLKPEFLSQQPLRALLAKSPPLLVSASPRLMMRVMTPRSALRRVVVAPRRRQLLQRSRRTRRI